MLQLLCDTARVRFSAKVHHVRSASRRRRTTLGTLETIVIVGSGDVVIVVQSLIAGRFVNDAGVVEFESVVGADVDLLAQRRLGFVADLDGDDARRVETALVQAVLGAEDTGLGAHRTETPYGFLVQLHRMIHFQLYKS
jgi:hypothetical protein